MVINDFCKATNKDIVVFDLEIKNEIGKNGVTWETHDKMGISVGVTYSFLHDEYKVFMDDNLPEMFDTLKAAHITSGFNTISFDMRLLAAMIPAAKDYLSALINRNYDCLVHSREASEKDKFTKGFKLDDHLLHIFGKEFMKTGDGASAPIWWQQGKYGKVISYCLDDVKREKQLFEHFWTEKWTRTAHGQFNLKTTPMEFFTSMKENKQ